MSDSSISESYRRDGYYFPVPVLSSGKPESAAGAWRPSRPSIKGYPTDTASRLTWCGPGSMG